MNRSDLITYRIIPLLAFCIYSLYNFFYLAQAPIFADESRFIAEAIHFANTGEFRVGGDVAWEMPLTGIFYGVIYYFVGSEGALVSVVRFLQSLMLILQAFMIAAIARIIFKNEIAPKIAFVIMLFYPFFIYYQALLLSETLFITLLIAAFYFLYRWSDGSFESKKELFLSISFFALATYTKGTLTILPPLLITLFYFVIKQNLKSTIKVGAIAAITYFLLLSPWWIRNYILLDSFVPFTTSSSMNLYLGNNSGNLSGGCDWSKDVDFDEVARLGSISGELERSKAYSDAAKKFIKENPDRFLELARMKFVRFWNVIPNADGFNQGLYKYIALFSFGPILLLAIASLFTQRYKWRELLPIFALLLYFTLIYSITIASLRYRLPLEPFLILLAASALLHLWPKLFTQRKE